MDTNNIKYLDPKNDLTFRKIFGQHPNIMMSFLNSLLPLKSDQYITEIIYLDPGLIPELPELKHSIVDVRCTDNFNRQFIVEMQMYWTNSFKNRMLFNAGKAYVKQIDRGHKYTELRPVYGLSLVNDVFLTEDEHKDKFYHHYRLAHQDIPDETVKGIELIFIELPKFKTRTFTDKKIRNLWLRFLTEIDEETTEASNDLISENFIKEALDHLQISAFTKGELAYYDKYWDSVRTERSAIHDALEKGRKKGQNENKKELIIAKQREKEAKQREKEAKQKQKKIAIKLAKKMLKYQETIEDIISETNLSKQEIQNLN